MEKNNFKKNKLDILFILIMLLSLFGTIFIFKELPDKIPTHWNIKEDADNYSSKSFAYLTALLPVFMYLLMKVIPKIDPKKDSYKEHEKAFRVTMFSVILFLIGIHWYTLGYSLGYPLDIIKYIKISLGIMFVIIGRYMPQIRFNYFFGIKTPWTLSSSTVWIKTHMVGGYFYFVMGIVFILSSFFNTEISFYISIGSLVLISLGLILYSYILYKKEKNYKA